MSSLIPNINKTFLQELFSKEDNNSIKRPDNRSIKEYRPISINRITSSYNSPIKVSIGNTQIISLLNAKLVQPRSDRPNEGIISFQVDTHHLKPAADFFSANEALTEFRISINNILEKCLKESHALDTNILCVIPGKIVWKITLEINVIKNDGNIFDTAIIAALSSWLTYKIPFFRIKEGELYYDSFINLTTIHMPVCVTNGIFLKNKKEKIIFILDNTLEEENVMSGNVSICGNIFGEISYMQMNTETQVGLDDIEELIGSMDENVRYIHNIIKKFVEEENKRVDKIIKSLKISEKKEEKEGNDIEYKENEEIKKNLKDKMDIEEKSEKIINILEYKK
jgi:exosome complex component RRP45